MREPRQGAPAIVEIEGQALSLAELRTALLRETPGASLAYLSDFRLDATELARLAGALRGVGTLVCEAQYCAADAELAARAIRLTTTQAAALCRSATARRSCHPFWLRLRLSSPVPDRP